MYLSGLICVVKKKCVHFCEQSITLLYQVLEKIDAVKEKQLRGVDVSLIALPVKVQLKMLRGELIQHGCSSSSNKKKATRESMCRIFLLYVLHMRETLRLSPSILPQMALSHHSLTL